MDNETMDRRIIEAIRSGRNKFYLIDAYIDANDFRQVDRRLQALRKQGVIAYKGKDGWAIAASNIRAHPPKDSNAE